MKAADLSSPVILASTSPFRRELLGRLGLPFEAVAPDYVEGEVAGLAPRDLAARHAAGKARSVARLFPGRVVIGSDQVAELDGRALGKPEDAAAAVAQLTAMAGRRVLFHTGLALVRDAREELTVETFAVVLRRLPLRALRSYVEREQPLGCAGSFRIEGLGIALMEALEGRDYTALIGLPLIALTSLLARFGVDVLPGLPRAQERR
ncbi:MAG: septum formation protein Maf [Deltaproteobacteria bacterium]|nr:septum formation protein Maf [Deltaproteobacteria bacterium]